MKQSAKTDIIPDGGNVVVIYQISLHSPFEERIIVGPLAAEVVNFVVTDVLRVEKPRNLLFNETNEKSC